MIDELERGALTELSLPDAAAITLPVYALYGSRDHIAAKVRDFLEFFIAHLEPRSGMQGRDETPERAGRPAEITVPARSVAAVSD